MRLAEDLGQAGVVRMSVRHPISASMRVYSMQMVAIRSAVFPVDTPAVLEIWREFIASASVSLAFQGNEADFAELPGKYAPPGGQVLLGEGEGRIEGCIAMRKVDNTICEMKRLYVRPNARTGGLGRLLVEALIADARKAGYAEIRLDVLPEFTAARRLYADLGFAPAEPVSFNPVPGTSFLGLKLE